MRGVDPEPAHRPRRTFLVTGASGFIGGVLCQRLRTVGHVRAIVRRDVDGPWDESERVDLTRDEVPLEALADVDVVFHLAAKTHDVLESSDAALYERLNVNATRALLVAAGRAGVRRFVFVSSVKAGERDASHTPVSIYGRTKLEAENLVLRGGYVDEGVILRLPLVYGPAVKGNIARMVQAVSRGAFPPVPEVGNRRSMVHVDDVARAAVLAAHSESAVGRIFVVTDGRAYSTRAIYESMRRALGMTVPRWSVPVFVLKTLAAAGSAGHKISGRRLPFDRAAYAKLLGSAYYDDGGALERELGFRPRHNLFDAMPSIVASLQPRD